jgi:cell division control protein 6
MINDDVLHNVFEKAITGKPLIRRRDVLRADYVPEKLLFRDDEIRSVAEPLSPLLKGARASNLFLYGKPGTGKTVVARHVLKHLRNRAAEMKVKVALAYSNTKITGREYSVLVELGSALGLKLPPTGLASGDLFSKILAHINELGINTVFVLDEIDFLVKRHGDEILYEMTRANERLKKGSLGLIGISNDLNFKEFLDPRVLSSLSEEEIVFSPYTVEELKGILTERSKEGFHDGVVKEAAINLCAAMAGSEHGDARRAVDLLRVAGEVAEREGASFVDEKHIRVAEQKIEQDTASEALRSLAVHEKIIVYSVMLSEKGSTGDIFDKYKELCRKLSLEPVTQRRVGMIVTNLDTLGLLSAPVINQGRYGRTKRISLGVQPSVVKNVFKQDSMMATLI